MIDTRQAVDFGTHRGGEDLMVVGHIADTPAIALGMLDVFPVAAGIDHEFLGHTAADDAGSAHPVFLGDADPGSGKGRKSRCTHAARTSSDNEEVIVVCLVGHRLFLFRCPISIGAP